MDEPAYRVPFDVRCYPGEIAIANTSDDDVPWVSVNLIGAGVMTPLSPGRLPAGGEVRAQVKGDLAIRNRLQLTWMRHDGEGPFVWQSGL